MPVLTLVLMVASAASVAVLILRLAWSGLPHFAFLGWNLFLAWVPYLLSLLMWRLHRSGRVDSGSARRVWLLVVAVPWLAFLPNAPYIVTDFIHLLRPRRQVTPLWLDATLVSMFALTGMALGLASLLLVHRIVAERLSPLWGWTMATGAVLLSTVGIYIGRVHRFNSWDLISNVDGLLQVVLVRLTDPLGNPALLSALGLGSAGLMASYLVTYVVAKRVAAAAIRSSEAVNPILT